MSSPLERRVQILLERAQYEQLEREAARAGKSVAAVIREGIAMRLGSTDIVRRAAADRLLAAAGRATHGRGDDWADMKREYEEHIEARLS
jgi:hypothetical protein